ncbi:MAG: GNAT family N-acetyltransferase [Acidilobaceae archaeon]|nr:GNAT family N-acetyltransferase [Acidilobaceae archaeon]
MLEALQPATAHSREMGELPSCGALLGAEAGATIRGACVKDLQALLSFYESLDPESLYRRFHGAVKDLEEYVESLKRSRAFVAIAEVGGEIVGAGEAVPVGGGAVEVGVAVRKDMRGKGLGTAMARGLLGLCRERGFWRFVAYTDASNLPALRIARKFGASVSYEGDLAIIIFELPSPSEQR